MSRSPRSGSLITVAAFLGIALISTAGLRQAKKKNTDVGELGPRNCLISTVGLRQIAEAAVNAGEGRVLGITLISTVGLRLHGAKVDGVYEQDARNCPD